jgi:hypothetical protein
LSRRGGRNEALSHYPIVPATLIGHLVLDRRYHE